MTATTLAAPVCGTDRPRPKLVSAPLLLRYATMLGASTSFYLLLSVVPLYARAAAGGGAAGLATAALMAATVAGVLVTPRLTARYGHRLTLAAGLILLGGLAIRRDWAASPSVVIGRPAYALVSGSHTSWWAPRIRQVPACPAVVALKYPSPDRCLSLQLAPAFVLQPQDQVSR